MFFCFFCFFSFYFWTFAEKLKKNLYCTLDIVMDRNFIVIKETQNTCNGKHVTCSFGTTFFKKKNCMIHSRHLIAQLSFKNVKHLRVWAQKQNKQKIISAIRHFTNKKTLVGISLKKQLLIRLMLIYLNISRYK